MAAPRTAVLVKFPPEVLALVDEHAAACNLSRTAAILDLIDRGRSAPVFMAIDPAKPGGDKAKTSTRRGKMAKADAVRVAVEQVAKTGAQVVRGSDLSRPQDRLQLGASRAAPGSLLIAKKYRRTGSLAEVR